MSYPPYPGPPEAAPGFPRYGPAASGPAGGYPPPGYYIPVPRPEPARGLMISAIVIAATYAAIQVIEAGLAWLAQQEYVDAAQNGISAYDVFTAYDLIAIPQFPLLIAAYVVTCLWLYKVRTNAEAIFPGAHHARSSGWVWGGWVCPVVSLWFPFQIVRDVSRDPREFTSNTVIGWWWAMWLISLITDRIGTSLVGADEIDEGAASALGTVETINATFVVIAFVLWVLTIRRIGSLQDRLMGITR